MFEKGFEKSIKQSAKLANIKHCFSNDDEKKVKVPSSCVKIVFECAKLPDKVILGFVVYSVREFIPEPVQCYKCQRYGHIDFFLAFSTPHFDRNSIWCQKWYDGQLCLEW